MDNSGYNPASLAYLGDAVFELLVRCWYIQEHNAKAGFLHDKAVKTVNAGAQAKMAEKLLEALNAEEAAIYRRGRNTAAGSMPKNASPAEYSKATGLEAVFGYLYMEEKMERILELFGICMGVANGGEG